MIICSGPCDFWQNSLFQNLKATHNTLRSGDSAASLLAKLAISKSESNSQRIRRRRMGHTSFGKTRYFKIWKQLTTRRTQADISGDFWQNSLFQNLKATHNEPIRDKDGLRLLAKLAISKSESNSQPAMLPPALWITFGKTRYFKIWKQLTTVGQPGRPGNVLLAKLAISKSESNSQLLQAAGEYPGAFGKTRYFKIWKQLTTVIILILCTQVFWQNSLFQNLKATHNQVHRRRVSLSLLAKLAISKSESNSQRLSFCSRNSAAFGKTRYFKIWKQLTTKFVTW